MTSEREALVIIMEHLVKEARRQNRSAVHISNILDEWKAEDERVYRCPKCGGLTAVVLRGGGEYLMCEDCRFVFNREEAK